MEAVLSTFQILSCTNGKKNGEAGDSEADRYTSKLHKSIKKLAKIAVKGSVDNSSFPSMLLESQISSQPLATRITNNAFKSSFTSLIFQPVLVRTIGKLKKLFFLSPKLLLLRLCLLQSKPKFFGSLKMVKWTQGLLLAMTIAMHCARSWTEPNCYRDVSLERPLITSRLRARLYAS